MRPLVEIPELGRHDAPWFAALFSPEAWAQFQRYMSGLIVSENNTVDGINRIFVVDVRNQSRLNRFLHERPCAVEAVNQARLKWFSSLAGTQMKPKGIWSVDDTRLTHDGQHFEKMAYLDDSTQGCDVWAHHLVNRHDSDDQTDYPVDFRFWEPVEIDALEAGRNAAGVPLRAGTYVLKDSDPNKWRNDLLHWWRRHQHQPAVQQLYQRK